MSIDSRTALQNTTPDVSVVIVTLNAAGRIEDCLRSLLEPDPSIAVEVIVSDNGSTDSTVDVVKRFPQVILLRGENIGYGAGNNRGIAVSRGRYVLVLNDDTLVLPGTLAAMVAFMDAHGDVGLAGPKLVNADGTLQPSITTYPRAWRDIARVLLPPRLGVVAEGLMRSAARIVPAAAPGRHSSHDRDADVEGVKGACMLVRRRVIDTVGVFDEAIFLHTEESDWAYRIRQAGWRVVYHPAVAVVHFGGTSFGSVADESLGRRFIQKHKSNLYFLEKHHGPGRALVYRIGLGVALSWRLALTSLALLGARGAAATACLRRREVFQSTLRTLWDADYARRNIFLEIRFKHLA